jgi:hypothetical protein
MAAAKKLKPKTIAGALVWIVAIGALTMLIRDRMAENSIGERLVGYFGKRPAEVELYSVDYQLLGFGDPIFVLEEDGARRVGKIAHIDFGEGFEKYKLGDTKVAIANFFGNAPEFTEGDYLEVHEIDQSIDWVIRTMFPAKMREKIVDLISDAWKTNQDELVALFRPLVEESLNEASAIIQEDLRMALENHRDQIDAIAQRYQEQLLEKELIPLVREEIWPIVQEEAQPLVETIGQEIWKEVSVWRFGWRYIYDRSPLPEKKLTEKEFNRFVDRKAVPILEGHLEDFIDVQKRMLTKVSENEKVKKTVSNSLREIATDPEFQKLVASIIREVLVENPRLREAIRSKWQSPAAQRAMVRANQRLDPTVIEIGATLFGSTKTAITPEFARVLRNKVLHKDARWLTLHTKADGNRDSEIVKTILESGQIKVENESGMLRLPMFFNYGSEDYPVAAAPPVKQADRVRKKAP